MNKTTIMEFGRISLVKNEWEHIPTTVEFTFTNQSFDHWYSDEEVEEEITKEDAEKLIAHLQQVFGIKA